MTLAQRNPMVALRPALFSALNGLEYEGRTVPVRDRLLQSDRMPYIALGIGVADHIGGKDRLFYETRINIHVFGGEFSEGSSLKATEEISDKVINTVGVPAKEYHDLGDEFAINRITLMNSGSNSWEKWNNGKNVMVRDIEFLIQIEQNDPVV